MIEKVTAKNFERKIKESEIPVLLKFSATWCGPCQAMLPVTEQVAKEQEGKLRILEIDIDESEELRAQYQVEAVPTFILLKGGVVIDTKSGRMEKEELEAFALQ